MNTRTATSTYTLTDIRNVWECFSADLTMLAWRTQAMEIEEASQISVDILTMVQNNVVDKVHIQLNDQFNRRVRAHVYSIHDNINWVSQRPSENKWPCLPDGQLIVIVRSYASTEKWNQFCYSTDLNINWCESSIDTQYADMSKVGDRRYASNGYGWQRNTYSIF